MLLNSNNRKKETGLQILPDNPRNDPYCHAPFFVQLGDGKADIIFLAGSAVIKAGMGHGIDAVGKADIDHALMHICDFAGIFALDVGKCLGETGRHVAPGVGADAVRGHVDCHFSRGGRGRQEQAGCQAAEDVT